MASTPRTPPRAPALEHQAPDESAWLEVIQKMIPLGVTHEDLRRSLPEIEVAGFFEPHAAVAAAMREKTGHLGTSLADRACLAQALVEGVPVLTADRNLARAEVEVEVRLIR